MTDEKRLVTTVNADNDLLGPLSNGHIVIGIRNDADDFDPSLEEHSRILIAPLSRTTHIACCSVAERG